ncbi:MAG TPA: hemolysin family protein [Methanocorpusculum sp.]|nr:hemolysin family protein [Methanocorpusculum sp.]
MIELEYLNIVAFVILLLCSAFFSASEVSLVGINRAKVMSLAETGRRGRLLEKLKSKSDHFLITILIGNNIANVGASAIATSIAIKFFGDAGVAIATGVVTFILLVVGEIGPKTYANHHMEKFALFVSTPIYVLTTILKPFFIVYDFIKHRGKKVNDDAPALTEEEIREWIDAGEQEGAIEEDEKEMIYSVLRFNDTTAKEIMTPRPDVVVIEDITPIEEAVLNFKNSGYSRIPVYHGNTDNIVGILNIKDLFNTYSSGNSRRLIVKALMVDVYCVPESKKIDDLLREFQSRRVHIAIVINEFGGFSGIVSLEDILEELVGDIMDETDNDEAADIIEIDDGIFMLDAQTRVSTINEKFSITLPEDPGCYETIGGLVFSYMGHIPSLGESVEVENVRLIVTKMKSRQILSIKMILPDISEDDDKKEEDSE